MEEYRVVLVDDEEEIRMGISRRIDWGKLGFSLAGEAQNGFEALELCEQIKPDVVITDIKMPFMGRAGAGTAAQAGASRGKAADFNGV